MAGSKIVVIGSSNMDLVVNVARQPVAGETVMGQSFFVNPGGKGANQAVAVKRLGGDVTFVTKIGKDLFGQQLRAHYADEYKGCCIELEVTSKKWERVEMRYSDKMPTVCDDVKKIITTKSKEWQHQQEVRYLKKIIRGSRESKTLIGLSLDCV